MRLRVALGAILIVALVVPVAAQQYPSPPFYQLLPPDYPYPLVRVCSTQWGICAIPAGIVPGTPCLPGGIRRMAPGSVRPLSPGRRSPGHPLDG